MLKSKIISKGIIFLLFILLFFPASCSTYEIKPFEKSAAVKSEGVLNLVFCSLNYPDSGIFEEDVKSIVQRLKKASPFDEFSNFGFWQVFLSRKEENEVFKPTQAFPPLKVRKDLLMDISAKLKGGYKLIIVDASGSVSCAELSLPEKTSLIILGKNRYKDANSFARGFLHELGHSLGLRDECVDCAQLSPSGYPNCASSRKEAEEWWGDLVKEGSSVNYISGCCGNRDYIRPTAISLMNDTDKAEDFGPVNERYLKKALGITY